MNYYDLHVHSAFSEGTSSLEQLAETAKKLNFSGFCFVEYFQDDDQIKKDMLKLKKQKKEME